MCRQLAGKSCPSQSSFKFSTRAFWQEKKGQEQVWGTQTQTGMDRGMVRNEISLVFKNEGWTLLRGWGGDLGECH